MYQLEILPINESANSSYFNDWLNSEYTILGVAYSEVIIVSFYSEPTEEVKTEIRDKYNSLTHLDVLLIQPVIDEIARKEMREEYGLRLYNFTSAASRLERLSEDPVPPHEQYRKDNQDPLDDIVFTIKNGSFKSVYEKLNEFVTNEHITEGDITTYRILVANYIVASPVGYTDALGLKVQGGQYPEHVGDEVDENGFINNYN